MPAWRKLHVKTVESLDFNDLPDDFSRLLWLLLPLKLCRDGRGPDIPQWVISSLFPLRSGVSHEQVVSSFGVYHELGMIERYEVNGRKYFQVKNWQKYQGKTDREAESPYPPPESGVSQDLLMSRSGVGQEQGVSRSCSDADADADAKVDADADAYPDFRTLWISELPNKPKPRGDNETLRSKFKTRMKRPYFRDNWRAALQRAGASQFIASSPWFVAGWFLKNDENWENCLDGKYDDADNGQGPGVTVTGVKDGEY